MYKTALWRVSSPIFFCLL